MKQQQAISASPMTAYTLNDFPNGVFITDESRMIIYCNDYFSTELEWELDALIGKSADIIFTLASKVFYQTYLVPTLLHENTCEEMQLTMINGKGVRIPITVNVKSDNNGLIYWSFFNASKRDKLYEELIQARETLEQQAEQLKLLASTDELTTLLNRREMKHRSSLAIELAARSHHSVALLQLDIDHFKKVNDAYGHPEGDRVLKELGMQLKKLARKTDLVSRFGGEEFLILLPDSNKQDAILFCERLHHLMKEIKIGSDHIQASIGLTISSSESTFKTLYSEVDNALYKAKESGRNRTELYNSNL
ncbi:GGDEF domain-containing protein [Psychromonas algicola]|uniref:GGDEF domain-containing protein n=1 Tax=Psychromonas algicola TaxID=2555642 RepID=UPI001419E74B|nr:sensor domain-containing diguanylate cyclase [Psychromonas sp. RZ5]